LSKQEVIMNFIVVGFKKRPYNLEIIPN